MNKSNITKAQSDSKIISKPLRKQTATTITDLDQKLLWGRAAGRCSICKAVLTFDSEDRKGTLGAMCHIVGEKPAAARGKSKLPLKDRNKYANLILLCSHHHDIIDKNVSKYPIEVVHDMKTEHELWVENKLGKHNIDPDDMVFSDLIDTITVALKLDHWSWFIDNAVRDLVSDSFVDAQGILNKKLLNTIWPQKNKKFKTAIVELIKSFDQYITHYLTNADPDMRNNFLRPDRTYAQYDNPYLMDYHEKEDRWSKANFWLLCKFTIKLNAYANAVRQYSNPLYFRVNGKFIIIDSMGFHFGGRNTLYDPALKHVEAELRKALQTEKKKLNQSSEK